MVDYNEYVSPNGVERIEITGSEKTELEAERTAFANKLPERQLKLIKEIRLQKLQETDWWVLRGDITDEQKLFRKNLRDIPANYDSSKYNELLARDSDGKLTHTVWEKP